MNKERKESLKRQREIANKVRKDFNILRKRISDIPGNFHPYFLYG